VNNNNVVVYNYNLEGYGREEQKDERKTCWKLKVVGVGKTSRS